MTVEMKELKGHVFQTRTHARYDWGKLCNGSTWELQKGIHYRAKLDSVKNSMYQQARRIGKLLRMEVVDEGLECEVLRVMFYAPGEEQKTADKPASKRKAAGKRKAAAPKRKSTKERTAPKSE